VLSILHVYFPIRYVKVTVSTIWSDLLNRIFFSQTWTDVSKNSSKTAKNTEKWFSRNISGKTCSQAIRVWATLIQVNQDDSASVLSQNKNNNIFKTSFIIHYGQAKIIVGLLMFIFTYILKWISSYCFSKHYTCVRGVYIYIMTMFNLKWQCLRFCQIF
jgi:hypothetical protein